MNESLRGRRDFLKTMTALGAAGLPAVVPALRPRWLYAADSAAAPGAITYNPAAKFEIKVSEVEFRRNAAGRMLMARIYQPDGAGPFPTMLDLHGGAWNGKDRLAEEPMDRALAASGVLVVAIDMTLAPEAPYPACVQDANYGVRWLKWKAPSWGGDPSKMGVYGSSSGGHVAELLSMRPRDARYNAIALPEAPNTRRDGCLCRDALADQRSLRALPERGEEEARGHDRQSQDVLQAVGNDIRIEPTADSRTERSRRTRTTAHHAGSARRQRAAVHPGKIREDVQGGRRLLRLPAVRGIRTPVGGQPGPQTDRAREMVKAFIARNLRT